MLSDIAIQIGGKISGPDAEFFGFSSDTRSLEAGDLYVALTGESFDGNNFVEEDEVAEPKSPISANPHL